MKLGEAVARIAGFATWTHAERIRYFAWVQHVHRARELFMPRDIEACFDECSVHPPANLHRAIDALLEQKDLLKTPGGYKLAVGVRSRLDQRYGQRPSTVEVHQLLEALPGRVSSSEQRAYLDEAVICARHGAWRGAILLSWNLAFDHLCHHGIKHKLSEFNAGFGALGKKKPAMISVRADLQELKESEVITVARSTGVTNKTQHKCLEVSLGIRNDAAHPSGAPFNQPKAEAFILEVVQQIVLGLTP